MINKLLDNLNCDSDPLTIIQCFKKMKDIKLTKGYYSGFNIVKYLIRE